jgi:hypothetical protein
VSTRMSGITYTIKPAEVENHPKATAFWILIVGDNDRL